MSEGWPVNSGASSYQIAPNIFSNDALFADIFDNSIFPDVAGEISDSQGSNSSASSNDNRHPVPPGIPEQRGSYLPSVFHQYIGQTQQHLDTTSDSSHIPSLHDTATGSGAYDLHGQPVPFDSIYNTTGYSAPRIGGTFSGLTAADTDLGANTNVLFNQLLYNPRPKSFNSETCVNVCGLEAIDRASYATPGHVPPLNSTDMGTEPVQDQSGCVQQVVRERGKCEQLDCSIHTELPIDATESQDTSTLNTSPQQASQASNIAYEQQHTDAKLGDQPSQKHAAIEQTSVFQEPDASYNFVVTDKNDIFLDPKLEGDFGKHDPHLAKKVSDAVKALKEAGSKPKEQHLQPSPTPGHHQVLWRPPVGDYSIPRTSDHYKICFDLLVKAIDYSGEDVAEKRDTVEFQRRWIKRDYYGQGFVQVLAKQVLDTMIDIHQHGWTYSVQDPVFRHMYHKTMYFTFRDRFNVTALVLKHSKTACNDLMKGQRLYDVIGNSYHLETRVTSNKKANRDRALRLAAEKLTREQIETGTAISEHADIKRTHEEDSEGSIDETIILTRPNKRNKINGGIRLSADAPNAVSPESSFGLPAETPTAAAKQPQSDTVQSSYKTMTVFPAGRRSTEMSHYHEVMPSLPPTAQPTKIIILTAPALKKVRAWPCSAGVHSADGAHDSAASGNTPSKGKSSRRVLARISRSYEHDNEQSTTLIAKKAKPKARVIAQVEKAAARASITALAKAKFTVANDDDRYDHNKQTCSGGKGTGKPVSGSRPKRTSTRTRRSYTRASAGSPPETTSVVAAAPYG